MFSWQWESFKEIIDAYSPIVDDHGPLAGPVHRFTIRRDPELRLCMETEAPRVRHRTKSALPARHRPDQ